MEYFHRGADMPEIGHSSQNITTDRITREFIVGKQGMACLFRFKDPMTMKAHRHLHEQISVIQFGRFRFRIDGVERVVGPGDVLLIPDNVEHGYDVLEPDSVDLEYYSPVRGFPRQVTPWASEARPRPPRAWRRCLPARRGKRLTSDPIPS